MKYIRQIIYASSKSYRDKSTLNSHQVSQIPKACYVFGSEIFHYNKDFARIMGHPLKVEIQNQTAYSETSTALNASTINTHPFNATSQKCSLLPH